MTVVSAAEENIVSVMSDPKKIAEAMNTPTIMSTLYLNFMLILSRAPSSRPGFYDAIPFKLSTLIILLVMPVLSISNRKVDRGTVHL